MSNGCVKIPQHHCYREMQIKNTAPCASGSGKKTQSVRCLLCNTKTWFLILDPHAYIKSWHSRVHLKSQCKGGRDRRFTACGSLAGQSNQISRLQVKRETLFKKKKWKTNNGRHPLFTSGHRLHMHQLPPYSFPHKELKFHTLLRGLILQTKDNRCWQECGESAQSW